MTSAHPFRLTFGCTYHGIQCRSIDKIIFFVDQKGRPALAYNAPYVGMSRVHEGKNIRVLCIHEGSLGDDWRHCLLCLAPTVMVVRYMLHLNGYDKAHAHLVHLYAQHGIDYNQPVKPPHKEKNDKATKSISCPQGCGRSCTVQAYLRMHLLKCNHRRLPDDACTQGSSTTAPPHTTTNQDSTTQSSLLATLVIENVFFAEQQYEGDFNAAANVASEMLDDARRAHHEKKGKQ